MRYPIVYQSLGGATPLMYACQQSKEAEVLDILMKQPQSVRDKDRTLKTPLHYCAENANTKCAEAILQMGPELVNSQDENGYCPLHLAVIAGNKPLIKLLISKGADVNMYDNEGHSAVHWAIVSGELEALEMIIQAGADPSTPDIHGGYPLHYAVQMCGSNYETSKSLYNAVRVVQKLLRHGVNVNVMDKDGRQPILWAASAGSAQIIKDLINNGARVDAADKDGLTALHCAASRGHTETIETLVVNCGAEVDVIDGNGCSALFYAVTLGHADATAILLQLGADPNRQDRKGRTPAHCGAAKGQLETLRILEKFGGNLWLRNVKGDFPFHEAVASGRRDLVLWFLHKNPDAINVGNNDGRCPLHVAAMYNNVQMIKMLLEGKCMVNPVMRSSKGILMTPLNVALCKGHRSCAKILQLHGGVPFSKVSKSNAYQNKTISLSPQKNRIARSISYWGEEITSPSFTVIKAGHGDDDDQITAQNERKKVYRRRKKRKSNSNGKKSEAAESDSEDSLHDERLSIITQEVLIIPGVIDESTRKKERRLTRIDVSPGGMITSEGITSIILTDDRNDGSVDFEREAVSKDGTSVIKQQKKILMIEPKKMSSLSPDYFPPGMLTINQLDSEITEAELDGTRTPNESENVDKELNTSGLMVTISDTGESKSSIQSESTEKTKANKRETEDDSKTSDLLSPSFTVLKDQTKEKSVSDISGEIGSEETKNDSPNIPKEVPMEKTTKIIHTKSSTIKRHEKTTKSIIKKEGKLDNEDNFSSNSSKKSEKSMKTTKSKTVLNAGKENKNIKILETEKVSITDPDKQVEIIRTEVEESLLKPEKIEKLVDDTNEKKDDATHNENVADAPSVSGETEILSKPADVQDELDTKKEAVPENMNESASLTVKNDSVENVEKDIPPSNEVLITEETVIAEIHQPGSVPDLAPESLPYLSVDKNDDQKTNAEKQDSPPPKTPSTSEQETMVTSEAPNDSVPMDEESKTETGVKTEDELVKEEPVELEQPKEAEKPPAEPENNVIDGDVVVTTVEEVTIQEEQPSLRNTMSMPDINVLDHESEPDLSVEQTESMGGNKATMSSLQLPAESTPNTPKSLHARYDYDKTVPEEKDEKIPEKPSASEFIKNKAKIFKRDSENYITTGEPEENPEGNRNESLVKENLEEDAEVLIPLTDDSYEDCEVENSLQGKTDNNWLVHDQVRTGRGPRVSRLCRRNKDSRETAQISVNQLVQGTIRKYHLERGIFHQLLELKRLQIRAGRANEQVLVKRLVDEYERSCASLGMRHYTGTYRFKEFEKFLYDQLRTLNRGHLVPPEMKSYDDIDALSGILKKSRFKIMSEMPPYEPQCACLTQRCHHSTKAYTTLPCSAYVARIRHNKSHRPRKESFLPSIYPYRTERDKFDNPPTTLELIQGDKKQVIELPPAHPERGKKYYITFTIKSAHTFKEDDYTDDGKDFFKHRHAKSV